MLIVIDSLASKSIDRISSTIQISDTGIVPGGGVGNAREELSVNTIGIPVIAMGVPMVVDLRYDNRWRFRHIYRKTTRKSRIKWIFKQTKRTR